MEEHYGSLLFINPSPESHRKLITLVEEGVLEQINTLPCERLLSDNIEHNVLVEEKVSSLEEERTGQKEVGQKKESNIELFLNEVERSVELETLKLTLNRHSWGEVRMLQEAVLDQVGKEGFNQNELVQWASIVVSGIAACSVAHRREFAFLGQDTLSRLGLSPAFEPPSGSAERIGPTSILNSKRPAQFRLEGSSRDKSYIVPDSLGSSSSNPIISYVQSSLEALEVTPKKASLKKLAGTSTPAIKNAASSSSRGTYKGTRS